MNTNLSLTIFNVITNPADLHLSIASPTTPIQSWVTVLAPYIASLITIIGVILAAIYTLKRGILDARYDYASSIFEYRIRQLTEFYAPMLVNVEKSRRLYDKLIQLLKLNEPDFKRSNFRLLDRIHLLIKEDRYKSIIEAILDTGNCMSRIISKKSSLIEGGVTNVYIDYVAHFEILRAAAEQPTQTTANPGWQKHGYYTRLLNREIAEGHKCIMSRIRPYMKAGDSIVSRLLNKKDFKETVHDLEGIMQTLRYYEDHAEDFSKRMPPSQIGTIQDKFFSVVNRNFSSINLPNRIKIMDFGCGSGRDTAYFLAKGCNVLAVDASPAMLRYCRDNNEAFVKNGQLVLQEKTFDEINYNSEFQGIWATAAFVHLRPEELRSIIELCANALEDNGVLYFSVKYGHGDEDYMGRHFYMHNEKSLMSITQSSNCFSSVEVFVSDADANVITGDDLSAALKDSVKRKKLFVNAICTKGNQK